jgi:predicted ATPase/DNA-binding CsgD family transcriptional regulator
VSAGTVAGAIATSGQRVTGRPADLPVPATALFGREAEVAAVRDLVLRGRRRLVTLTGPGGVGKTRLVLRVASSVADHFADGIAFVSLAGVADADLLPQAVAQALGAGDDRSPAEDRPWRERLADHLRDRQALLVLDNLEHLAAAAPEVSFVLAECHGLRVLATSRVRLRLADEQAFPVPPLPLPDEATSDIASSPAVALFVERARAVRPTFALTADASTVAGICRRLDGLPLAIELAAARVAHLPPAALLDRLNRRLPLLTGGARDAPTRHRTMRDAIAWSVDLLDPDARTIFARLGAFAGGFTLDAAERVMGDGSWGMGHGETAASSPSPISLNPSPSSVLDGITALVDASLVQFKGAEAEPEQRYAMLETVREYALELLEASGEADAVRSRLAEWLAELNTQVEAKLRAADEAVWLARLEAEFPNLRSILAWALDRGDAATALRLTTKGVWFLWGIRGIRREESRWLVRALDLAERDPASIDPALLGHGLHSLGIYLQRTGELEAACDRIETAVRYLEEAGDRVGMARAIVNLANTIADRGRYDEASRLLEEAVAIQRELGDPRLLIIPLLNLGATAIGAGDLAAARAALADAAEVIGRVGDARDRAYFLTFDGIAALHSGRIGEAHGLLAEALGRAREVQDTSAVAMASTYLALASHRSGRSAAAAQALVEPLTLVGQMGTRPLACLVLGVLAEILTDGGRAEDGARVLGATVGIEIATGGGTRPVDRATRQRLTEAARLALGPERFVAAEAAGRALGFEEAIAEGIALAESAAQEGDPALGAVEAGPGVPARSGPLAELTAREHEILLLVAEGHSDREIADLLSISHRTASNHVSRILAKLDVPTRTAAAAIALRDGRP